MGALPRPGSAARIRSSVRQCGASGIPALRANAGCGTVAGGDCAMTPPELALVVPCYNEAARLDPQEFLRFAATHPTVRLLMIDDGSVDATAGHPRAHVHGGAGCRWRRLRKPSRSGKAEAVRTGILAGIERGAALVGFLDADLSTPLRAIDDFLAVLRGRPSLEFILGLPRDAARARCAGGRRPGITWAACSPRPCRTRSICPSTTPSAARRFCASTRRRLTLFRQPFRSPWIFDVELIARYLRLPVAPGETARRDRLYELVVPAWHDIAGSKLRGYDFARAAVDLAYIWRERLTQRRHTRPTAAVPPFHPEAPARRSAAPPQSSLRGPQRIQCRRPS